MDLDEIKKNKGENIVKLLDVNNFSNGYYKYESYFVNDEVFKKIKNNPLFIRTVDTGKWSGRIGIYNVKDVFGVDWILVTKNRYRTHPIQIFFMPEIPMEDLDLLKNYFNLMLEYLRDITDSEFMTTFKYSNCSYIRKYLGLSQAKELLETFPVHIFSIEQKRVLKALIEQKNIEGLKDILHNLKKNKEQLKLFNL